MPSVLLETKHHLHIFMVDSLVYLLPKGVNVSYLLLSTRLIRLVRLVKGIGLKSTTIVFL